MKYFVAKMDDETKDMLGGSKYQVNEDFYSYCVEFGTNPGGTEEVTISDDIGRYIPVDIASLPELVRVLSNVIALSHALESVNAMVEDINNPHLIITARDE